MIADASIAFEGNLDLSVEQLVNPPHVAMLGDPAFGVPDCLGLVTPHAQQG